MHNLKDKNFYTVVGRCVPENNFETIIREFMLSGSEKDLVIITTNNPKMLKKWIKNFIISWIRELNL